MRSAPPYPSPTPFVHPLTKEPLTRFSPTALFTPSSSHAVPVVNNIPRFVPPGHNYARSFGYQWRRWSRTQSDACNNSDDKRRLLLARTWFDQYDIAGKTVLECGCGSGTDTEVLLSLPFSEVHAFDLSTSVEQAAELLLPDPRLTLSQASITRIPYPERSFDVVFCHRVLQHTPDPEASLRSVARMVKPGGLLFVHCYRRSPLFMRNFKYKYRPITRRLPPGLVARLIEFSAPLSRALNTRMRLRRDGDRWLGSRFLDDLAYRFVPLNHSAGMYAHLGPERELELEKLITFDALTPRFDNPMTEASFTRTLAEEGFAIDHLATDEQEPLYATARNIAVVTTRTAERPRRSVA